MKCYKHNEKDAVGKCKYCGAGLCNDCFKEFNTPICYSCNVKVLNNNIGSHYTTITTNLIIGIIFSIFVLSSMTGERDFSYNYEGIIVVIFGLYFSIFVSYGWSFINGLKDPNQIEVRIDEGLISLLFRKTFKLCFACLIGCFVGPYQLFKMIKEIKQMKQTLVYIKNNL